MYDRDYKVETFLLKNNFNNLELESETGEEASEEWNFGIFLDKKTYFVVDEDENKNETFIDEITRNIQTGLDAVQKHLHTFTPEEREDYHYMLNNLEVLIKKIKNI